MLSVIESLIDYFSPFGAVASAVVLREQGTAKSRGFGFVTFTTVAAANNALSSHHHVIDGRKVESKLAVPKGKATDDKELVADGDDQDNEQQNINHGNHSNDDEEDDDILPPSDSDFPQIGSTLFSQAVSGSSSSSKPIVNSPWGKSTTQSRKATSSLSSTTANNNGNNANKPLSPLSVTSLNGKRSISVTDARVGDKLIPLSTGNGNSSSAIKSAGKSGNKLPRTQSLGNISPTGAPTSPSATTSLSGPLVQNKIFVGGLLYATTHESLRKYFEEYGVVESAEVIFNRDTKKSRGFGFVIFQDNAPLLQVLRDQNKSGHIIEGKAVEIKHCIARQDMSPKSPHPGLSNKISSSSSNSLSNLMTPTNTASLPANLSSLDLNMKSPNPSSSVTSPDMTAQKSVSASSSSTREPSPDDLQYKDPILTIPPSPMVGGSNMQSGLQYPTHRESINAYSDSQYDGQDGYFSIPNQGGMNEQYHSSYYEQADSSYQNYHDPYAYNMMAGYYPGDMNSIQQQQQQQRDKYMIQASPMSPRQDFNYYQAQQQVPKQYQDRSYYPNQQQQQQQQQLMSPKTGSPYIHRQQQQPRLYVQQQQQQQQSNIIGPFSPLRGEQWAPPTFSTPKASPSAKSGNDILTTKSSFLDLNYQDVLSNSANDMDDGIAAAVAAASLEPIDINSPPMSPLAKAFETTVQPGSLSTGSTGSGMTTPLKSLPIFSSMHNEEQSDETRSSQRAFLWGDQASTSSSAATVTHRSNNLFNS